MYIDRDWPAGPTQYRCRSGFSSKGVACPLQRLEGCRRTRLGHQQVEIAQHAPAFVRVKTVDQSDRAFEQHGLDAEAVEHADDGRQLAAKLAVALHVCAMDGLEEGSQLFIQ
jgi:hypothetical protein